MPRDRVGPLTAVRSTLIASSLKSLRDRHLDARYLSHLPRHYHDTVRSCIAGVWLPIEVAVAHYEACEALGLSVRDQVEVGRDVGMQIQGSFLGTLVKLAKVAGVTPWLCMGQFPKLWVRALVGGGVLVTKVGPKEARIEFVNFQLARIPYVRAAFRGLNAASYELFCKRAYVVDIPDLCTPTSLGYQVSWV